MSELILPYYYIFFLAYTSYKSIYFNFLKNIKNMTRLIFTEFYCKTHTFFPFRSYNHIRLSSIISTYKKQNTERAFSSHVYKNSSYILPIHIMSLYTNPIKLNSKLSSLFPTILILFLSSTRICCGY